MRLKAIVPVRVRGLWAAGGGAQGTCFSIDFSDVQKLPAPHTYLLGLLLRGTLTHATGGAGDTWPEDILLRVFDRLFCRTPGVDPYYDLPAQAGPNLKKLIHALAGQRPATDPNGAAGTSLALTNGATLRAALVVPFQFPRSKRPEDGAMPLDDLQDTQLVVGTPNLDTSGIFDTGPDNQRFTAFALEAWAILMGSDKYVAGPRFSVTQHDQPGVNVTIPTLAGRRLHGMIEVPTLADNTVTATPITAANRTEYEVTNGRDGQLLDHVTPDALGKLWNDRIARGRAEQIPDHAAGASSWIPVVLPESRGWRITHAPTCDPTFKVKVPATDTNTTPRLVAFTTEVRGIDGLNKRLVHARVAVPPDYADPRQTEKYLRVETADKTVLPPGATAAAQALPIAVRATPDDRTA